MLLENLNIEDDVEGADDDFIPGGNFTLDTGAYKMQVKLAYLGESQGGAMNITLWLQEVDGKRQHRETFYVTSGKAKGQKNTFTDRSGAKRLLPGMEAMNQLAKITTGEPLAVQKKEAKIVKLYDFDERKELPKEVPVLTGMLNKPVLVLITKCRENKRQNVGGEWVDTDQERVFNEASKFLFPSGHSVAEKASGEEETPHRDKWIGKFDASYVRDKYKAPAVGAGVEAASATAAAANSAEVDSLFS